MTTTILNAGSDAHILEAKPNAELGGPAKLAVDSGQAIAFVQFPLGSRVPAGATVSEARLRVYQSGDTSGSWTLTARRVALWKAARINWDNQPTLLGSNVAVTQSDTADKAAWTFIVTADVQAWLAGAANYGWRITSSSTARRYLRGFDASNFKPVLDIDWTTAPGAPTDLVPSFGSVSVTKPVLSFTAPAITHLQVQIDPTGVFTSPTFDSGQTAATEALYDLSASAYGGLASGSTMWRARVWNASGVSAWSKTATFSRTVFPTLTITSPGAAVSDATPLVTWTFTGQTQRRVITRNAAGTILDDSDWATTTSHSYLPAKGVTKSGQAATVEVQARDAVVREATPGAPDYQYATQAYTFTFSATPVAVTSLTVTQPTPAPWPLLTWDRVEIPDEGWAIVRDDEIIATLNPTEPTTGDHYEWVDWTADPNREHTWFVAPIVDGETGVNGPEVDYTITTSGLWLADPDTGTQAVIWGDDEGSWESPEDAALYAPVNAEYVIRRVTSRRHPEGALAGRLADVPGFPTALECEAALESMIEDSATGTFRLVAGPKNIKVTLGDVNLRPTPLDRAADPIIGVSWSFWSAP